MKILFLDHQGVMFLKLGIWPNTRIKPLDFDVEAVSVLNNIIEETNCEIVVSSDWNMWVTLKEMGDFYIKQGILKRPIGYAFGLDDYKNRIEVRRSLGIMNWLKNNPNVTNWVCVDDLDLKDYITNFVWVEDTKNGIKLEKIKKEIKNYLQ
jgi:hypothetical protein